MHSKVCWIDCLYSCLNLDEGFGKKGSGSHHHSLCVCIRSRSCICICIWTGGGICLNLDEGFGKKGAATATIIQVPDCCRLCCHCCSDSTESLASSSLSLYHHHHYHCRHQPHRHIQLHWNPIYRHHQPSFWLVSKMFTFVDLCVSHKGFLMSINLSIVCICSWSCICICIWTGGGRWAWMNWPTDKGWPTASSFHKLSTRGPPCIWFLHFDIFDPSQIINWMSSVYSTHLIFHISWGYWFSSCTCTLAVL